jgi:hypothetical protein
VRPHRCFPPSRLISHPHAAAHGDKHRLRHGAIRTVVSVTEACKVALMSRIPASSMRWEDALPAAVAEASGAGARLHVMIVVPEVAVPALMQTGPYRVSRRASCSVLLVR